MTLCMTLCMMPLCICQHHHTVDAVVVRVLHFSYNHHIHALLHVNRLWARNTQHHHCVTVVILSSLSHQSAAASITAPLPSLILLHLLYLLSPHHRHILMSSTSIFSSHRIIITASCLPLPSSLPCLRSDSPGAERSEL